MHDYCVYEMHDHKCDLVTTVTRLTWRVSQPLTAHPRRSCNNIMADEQEDVKPKLNLNIDYQGTRSSKPFQKSLPQMVNVSLSADITVKVRANMSFKKIFEAAEVKYRFVFLASIGLL